MNRGPGKFYSRTVTSSTEIEVPLDRGRRATVGPARPEDALSIRWLYHTIYGGSYPFSLVYNAEECAKAISGDKHLWLLARAEGRVVASVIFTVDRGIRLGKVFGAVVDEAFRGFDLTERAIAHGLDLLMRRERAVESVYATTRTVSLAPQRLTEKLAFKPLGVFPNVHKVASAETHTLAVLHADGALARRAFTPRLPRSLEPFYAIARRHAGLGPAEFVDAPVAWASSAAPIGFETVTAPQFVLRRFRGVKSDGKLTLDFFPFQEPNLFLISLDGKTELYCYRSTKDGHCVITGARSESLELREMLDQGARFLETMGVRYAEALVEANDAEAVRQALCAGFLPSAYYPCMRWDSAAAGRDYVVMSRSLAMLDFHGVSLQSGYRDYLQEYFRLWRGLYVDAALSGGR